MTRKAVADDVRLGKDVKLSDFINLYGCTIGDNTRIGPFVEVQKNAFIGSNCKIQSHTFICEGVTIEDNVFIGHGVTFVNDKYPRATAGNGRLQDERDWQVMPTLVKQGASVGSGVTVLCNVTIGENAIVGSGSVVTRDVPPDTIVAGAPARIKRRIGEQKCADRALPHAAAADTGLVAAPPLAPGPAQEGTGSVHPSLLLREPGFDANAPEARS